MSELSECRIIEWTTKYAYEQGFYSIPSLRKEVRDGCLFFRRKLGGKVDFSHMRQPVQCKRAATCAEARAASLSAHVAACQDARAVKAAAKRVFLAAEGIAPGPISCGLPRAAHEGDQ